MADATSPATGRRYGVKGGGGVYRRAGEKMYRRGEAWSSTRGRGGLADQPASTAASGSRLRRRRLALKR